jgi:hypothetical protein
MVQSTKAESELLFLVAASWVFDLSVLGPRALRHIFILPHTPKKHTPKKRRPCRQMQSIKRGGKGKKRSQ